MQLSWLGVDVNFFSMKFQSRSREKRAATFFTEMACAQHFVVNLAEMSIQRVFQIGFIVATVFGTHMSFFTRMGHYMSRKSHSLHKSFATSITGITLFVPETMSGHKGARNEALIANCAFMGQIVCFDVFASEMNLKHLVSLE